jgi:membrane associated rhomboid family serine protease
LQYGVVPAQIITALRATQLLRLYPLITSMFIHAGVVHIFGNMLYLFVFGHNVEEKFGHFGYLLFYLVAGVGGALTQVYLSVLSGPPDLSIPSVGASAAISGVLGAYLLFFPRARVVSLVVYFILPIRAYWFILAWFFLQLLFLELIFSSAGINSGVAYGAHVGGFVVGLVIGGVVRLITGPAAEEEP